MDDNVLTEWRCFCLVLHEILSWIQEQAIIQPLAADKFSGEGRGASFVFMCEDLLWSENQINATVIVMEITLDHTVS